MRKRKQKRKNEIQKRKRQTIEDRKEIQKRNKN